MSCHKAIVQSQRVVEITTATGVDRDVVASPERLAEKEGAPQGAHAHRQPIISRCSVYARQVGVEYTRPRLRVELRTTCRTCLKRRLHRCLESGVEEHLEVLTDVLNSQYHKCYEQSKRIVIFWCFVKRYFEGGIGE